VHYKRLFIALGILLIVSNLIAITLFLIERFDSGSSSPTDVVIRGTFSAQDQTAFVIKNGELVKTSNVGGYSINSFHTSFLYIFAVLGISLVVYCCVLIEILGRVWL
jgi:hypothetical protein